ncbi:MAG TPA: PQQ-binding-like beta-propeller repeat protein [Gaiella sp.]|nr:PQQ-binding-like beta-propeller repeat protein [Gaiella sp.]
MIGGRRLVVRAGVVAVATAVVLVIAGCGSGGQDESSGAAADWTTNGGAMTNQRYSTLDDIDTSNVGRLKGVWRTHLNGSGIAAKYSGESQPIVQDGVIYITTGNDDVFAVSVDTGKILWEHKSNISQDISTICCGWLNRGVALGDGRVYLGQLDGKVVALDKDTGDPVWSRQLVQWQKGQTVTGAPLFLDGTIYIGVVGADFGTRGFLEAIDAETGKSVWRAYMVPGPGERGNDTWPDNSSYLRGGASIWSTPAYDPDLNLLYVTTGNAGNDWFGGDREGDNLYAASIVAIDRDTGKVEWHFQEVHHDIWDYDTPAPAMLFDVDANGGTTKGVAAPGKTGWLYLLDRETGKPLYGIDEKPVPQNAEQKTAKTQPFPRNGEFIPHTPPTAKEIARVKSEITGKAKSLPVVVAKEMFTPATTDRMLIYRPGPQGGNNWEPASYNPGTHMFYVCAADQTVGVAAADLEFVEGKGFAGIGAIAGIGYNESSGTLTAIDATDGSVAWQKQWPDACYSGTVTTRGNLLFVGRNNGELQAYDARTGDQLWSFQTGAGANDTVSVFEQNGKEYVAFLSAGNSLMATAHGDSLWLFSLDGTMGPAAAPGAGAGTTHKGEGGNEQTGDAAAGKTVFSDNCAGCHGVSGTGGNGGPDLTAIPSAKDAAAVKKQVEDGGGGMPAFKGTLTEKQIKDVTAYVTQNITNKK